MLSFVLVQTGSASSVTIGIIILQKWDRITVLIFLPTMSSYPFISLSPDPNALWFLWTSKLTKMHCHGDNCWMTLSKITELTGYSTVPYFIMWLGYWDISFLFLSGKHTIIYTANTFIVTYIVLRFEWKEIVNLTILPTRINNLCGLFNPTSTECICLHLGKMWFENLNSVYIKHKLLVLFFVIASLISICRPVAVPI